MNDTVITTQTAIQSVTTDQQTVAVGKETAVQVITAGVQGPPGAAGEAGGSSDSELSGSFNFPFGTYGVLNITLLNGLVQDIGLYGM